MGNSIFLGMLAFLLISGGISLLFFIIGFRGIITKNPFLISFRWIGGILVVYFLLSVLSAALFSKVGYGYAAWAKPLMYLVLFIFIFTRGSYMAFGVTDSSLREALLNVLKKMNIEFAESLASIKLPALSAELQVSVQSWTGTAQIRLRGHKEKELLTKIAKGVNAYFRETDVKKNMTTCYFYVIIAILMAILVFSFSSMAKQFPGEGVNKYYYDSGELKYEAFYANGQWQSNKEYSKDGKLKKEWLYQNGELNGISKEYYDSEELRYEYTYVGGRQEGLTKEFYKDGRLKGKWIYKDGEYTKISE